MEQARKTKVAQARDWLLKEIRKTAISRAAPPCLRSVNWPNRSGSVI